MKTSIPTQMQKISQDFLNKILINSNEFKVEVKYMGHSLTQG